MIIEADQYLDHAGVKGMRWGVRKPKPRPLAGAAKAAQERRIAAEKSFRRKRNLKRVAIAGGVIAAGGIIAAVLIRRHRATKLANVRQLRNFQEGINKSRTILNASSNVRLSEVRQGFAVNTRGVATPLNAPIGLVRSIA